MDNTGAGTEGQPLAISVSTVRDIEMLCELMQFLRAWWSAFEESLRKLDQVAAGKAYDAMIDGVILARGIARELGCVLPDFSSYSWAASPAPLGHSTSTVDL